MKLEDLVPESAIEEYCSEGDTLQRMQKLAEYDLSFLTNNFHIGELREFSPEQLFPLITYFKKFDIEMNLDTAKKIEVEFRKFVALTLMKPTRRNAPSGPVDMYWHFFVLHTPEYVEFSTEIFGDYGYQPRVGKHYFQDVADKRAAMVDHIPANEDTRPMMLDVYEKTRESYLEVFKNIDEIYWPAPTGDKMRTCGDSYSGFVAPMFKKEGSYELQKSRFETA